MNNLEFYKDGLIDVLCDGLAIDRKGKPHKCSLISCEDCIFQTTDSCQEEVKKWLYKEPIKLKQWEYDLLNCYNEYFPFYEADCANFMERKKGHFKGITDRSMTVKEILDNCQIVSDNYEWFEECK